MKIAIAFVAFALLVTGCAQKPVQFTEDVTLQPWQSSQAVKSVRFPAKARGGDLEFCIARHVVNNSVSFSDSADSFFGAFTGTYYHDTDTQTIGGGGVVQHSSDNGIIAVGVTSYDASPFVKRFVRFKLAATSDEYEFFELGQVQANSGAAPNTGFQPIGAFPGANPILALGSLKDVAVMIDSCRSN